MSVATEAIEEVKKLSDQLKKINIEDIQPDSTINSHFSLPISSVDNFDELDKYLSDAKQFSSAVIEVSKICGTDIYDFIKRSLSWVMKNSLLKQYTWHGTKEKKGLVSTKLGQVIIKAAAKTSKLKISGGRYQKICKECQREKCI
ncbi:hypothetical protein JTB14_032999 [Gonioctena quinquepunctata]|nr:hypothetical protein JTB14_032999 [Gonioctena quinquepunctata]